MTTHDLLAVVEEGVRTGRITPHLAAYIAAEVLGTAADEIDQRSRIARLTNTQLNRAANRRPTGWCSYVGIGLHSVTGKWQRS